MDNNDIKKYLKGAVIGVVCTSALFIGNNYFKQKDCSILGNKANVIAQMLQNNFICDMTEEELSDKIFTGMTNSLGDPYTVYFNRDNMIDFINEANGTICGIGTVIALDKLSGNCVISDVFEGSPAQLAGLEVGDIISEIDGKDISNMDIIEISALIKGEEGSKISLTVLKNNLVKKTYNIKRSTVNLDYVKSNIDNNIGYIKITEFSKTTGDQFKTKLSELLKKNIKGLVIDLRDNPGGIIDVVTDIADIFLPESTITYTIDKKGDRNDFKSDSKYIDLPLMVLVNGGSASASELFAGAIQDNKRGKIIGTQTFGKGIVQGLYRLNDGSGLKITIQKYYTPNGVCIQGKGITPDYIVNCNDTSLGANDEQYQKSLELLKEKIKD